MLFCLVCLQRDFAFILLRTWSFNPSKIRRYTLSHAIIPVLNGLGRDKYRVFEQFFPLKCALLSGILVQYFLVT